ncbi:MAG: HlyD family efflux transporter periplasmic adaptor subunit [Halieaceae bacterium]
MALSRNLRQDLELFEVTAYEDGSPRWRLYDPVTNRFFDLGWIEVELLRELRSNTDPELDSGKLARIIADRANAMCNSQQVDDFLQFLEDHDLFWMEGERALEQRQKLEQSHWSSLLQRIWRQYLFLRIPILYPDALLDRLLPYVGWAFRPLTWWILLVNTVLAVYLTSRQLDYFLGTFVSYFTPLGLVYFSLAVILAKILHEFGHALVARHFGCSVRAMGVALLVFWPILYTDTTDAWRLRSRRQRAMIGLAGMTVEMGIASICLLLWNLMPDGILRTILFMLSTSTWLMTLFVNLNPLMRFDGYYVLSDLSGVENLQERSNAMGRWRLREWIFGYGRKAPEQGRRWLIPFAYAVWLYRLTVFFGIAFIVYTYFFKALGVILAAAQVVRLLIMPIGKEVLLWWEWREDAARRHLRRSAVLLSAALLLLVVPVDNELELPAYWQSQSVLTLYAPIGGRLETMPTANLAQLPAGEEVVVIASPDLEFQLARAEHELRASKYQLERTSFNVGLAQDRLSLQAQLRGALEKKSDIQAQLDDARLVAPFKARITDLAPELRPGDWVEKGERLLTLVDDSAGAVIAYLGESELEALDEGAVGRFYPDGGTRGPLLVSLVEVDGFALETLEQGYVASTFGGGLDVRNGKDGELIPQRATYRIRLHADQPTTDRILRGQLVMEAEARSLLSMMWRRLVGIWRREFGV